MSEHVDINSLEDFIALYGEEVCMLKVSSFACPQFNFKSWNVRHSKKDGIDYDQMLCVLDTAATGRAA